MKQNFSHLGDINPFPGPHTPLRIPNKMVGLIIGKNGETVRTIHQKTNCFIFIPKDSRPGEDFRELELSGPLESVEMCKREIISMIHLALYGRLPYMNSLFYPYIDPVTGLPIIDSDIMASLDPNTVRQGQNQNEMMPNEMNFNQISMGLSMSMTGGGYPDEQPNYQENINSMDPMDPNNINNINNFPQVQDGSQQQYVENMNGDPNMQIQNNYNQIPYGVDTGMHNNYNQTNQHGQYGQLGQNQFEGKLIY